MPNQISIWFIHEQCFGVYTIRILWSLWCRNSARLSWFFNIPDLPLLPRSSDNPHCPATKRTRLSDLCIFKPSQTNVHGASGSVSINARMASTKSFSVRVLFKLWFFHTSCSNNQKTDEADRSMAEYIANSIMGCFPGNYRFIRIFVFQCLNACHFIHGDCMSGHFHGLSLLRGKQCRSHSLSPQKFPEDLFSRRNEASNGWDAGGFPSYFKKRRTVFADIDSTIPSFTTAFTSRLRLQWLTSYPNSCGSRQAISRILMICSSV